MKEYVVPAARRALRNIPEEHPDRAEIQRIIDVYGRRDLAVSPQEERELFAFETGKVLADYLAKYIPETPLSDIIPRVIPHVKRADYEDFLTTLSARQRHLVSGALNGLLRTSLEQARVLSDYSDPNDYPRDLIQNAGQVAYYVENNIIPRLGRTSVILLREGFVQFSPEQTVDQGAL
jgi:hypothetical protein